MCSINAVLCAPSLAEQVYKFAVRALYLVLLVWIPLKGLHVKGIVAILAAGTTAGTKSDWEEWAMSTHASVAGASECQGWDLESSGLIMSSTHSERCQRLQIS